MKKRSFFRNSAPLALMLIILSATNSIAAKKKHINVCSLVSSEQLSGIYKKELFPTELRGGCFWSEEPGAMAFFQVGYYKNRKDLRNYFSKELPSHVTLQEINDLGDGGLMSVNRGHLEVIVIKKNNLVLKSTVSFMDIVPDSKQHKNLWDIYRTILEEL